MLYLKTLEQELKCDQVVTSSNIEFLAPVTGDIVAKCESPEDAVLAKFFESYENKGRARISLNSTIESDGVVAVKFSGTYAIREI